MPLSTWLTFFLASWAISFSPGAGAISAMSSGLKYGFARGYWNTAGLIMGILFQFVVVAVGLARCWPPRRWPSTWSSTWAWPT